MRIGARFHRGFDGSDELELRRRLVRSGGRRREPVAIRRRWRRRSGTGRRPEQLGVLTLGRICRGGWRCRDSGARDPGRASTRTLDVLHWDRRGRVLRWWIARERGFRPGLVLGKRRVSGGPKDAGTIRFFSLAWKETRAGRLGGKLAWAGG